MRKPLVAVVAASIMVLGASAPAASAKEKVLTLYSPKIESLPYVHDTHQVSLSADGKQAPAVPGYITGWKEMALVDSKNPKAKPLPIAKMMVHHFLFFAPGTVAESPGSCWGGSGFIGGRGEEHPLGHVASPLGPEHRKRYGIPNAKRDGTAPDWRLTAMVMNHYKKPKSFYVRTRVYYTTEKRKPVMPIVLGDCAHLRNGMSYDVPGGGKKGSNFVCAERLDGARGRQRANPDRRLASPRRRASIRASRAAPAGGGSSRRRPTTARRTTSTTRSGRSSTSRARSATAPSPRRRACRSPRARCCGGSRSTTTTTCTWPRWASGRLWWSATSRSSAAARCPPTWSTSTGRDASTARRTTSSRCRSWPSRLARSALFDGSPLQIGDDFFAPGKITARAGETVTWSFAGRRPHSVTVANGPRGFSSVYWGRTRGSYSVTPTVKGTYKLVCLVHPTTMAQTLEVK